ncbi:MAG: hypothetical protein RLZZ623_1715 [Actinomycetota bacterium]
MAAEIAASAGRRVTVLEHMPSVGRKLLLAGRGGLNLTHSEPIGDFIARYGASSPLLDDAIRAFGPTDLRRWSASLGEETFVGSSGRVFPESFRATPLLRAWLGRLDSLGVTFRRGERWIGWEGDGADLRPTRLVVRGSDGSERVLTAAAVVLALGGASWPRVGSTGSWVPTLRAAGVEVVELRASNVGYRVEWSEVWRERFAGVPLKNIVARVGAATARGEAMITDAGIEGGVVYALGAAIRDEIDSSGVCTLSLDLHPDLDLETVASRLRARRPKDSLATGLRRSLGVAPVAVGLLREATGNTVPVAADALASLVKNLPLRLTAPMSLDRAISTAGGVAFGELDASFMVRRLPGVFVAGEMLDWDAPTGGYLLQASFSTGVAAARGALAWMDGDGWMEADG